MQWYEADIMGGSQITPEERDRWDRLTEKQRACLDLLLERKTSKEIARLLDISKYTVDQRLTAARITLDAADRADTAIVYARLKRICDRIAYDPVEVPAPSISVASDAPDGGSEIALALQDRRNAKEGPLGTSLPFGKIGRHDHRLTTRLLIMAVMFTTLIIFLGGSIGIAEALSRLIAR